MALAATACGDDEASGDGVDAAQARVTAAEGDLSDAQEALGEAHDSFCSDAEAYIVAIDDYGGIWDDDAATVGDVEAAGADLAEPRRSAESAAADVVDAREQVAGAQADLADAQAALAAAEAAAAGATTVAPPAESTTTTSPLVPEATVARVEQAESDLSAAMAGITAETPLRQAGEQFNAAAFALEVAWLQLLADAGCLSDEQRQSAVAAVREYTVAVQTLLEVTGYYEGPVDGVYGPSTIEAVQALQADNGLPTTGLVDRATAEALDAAVAASGGVVATAALTHTAAVQSTLKLAGYWTGPVDGIWTPELTEALMAFQTALGVEPTGAVDVATLEALQTTIAEAQAAATSTTTTSAAGETTTTTEATASTEASTTTAAP